MPISLSRLQIETGGDWGTLQSDRAVNLHRRVIAKDFRCLPCNDVVLLLQGERRSLCISYLHKVACIG
jgi:hypothetical protein